MRGLSKPRPIECMQHFDEEADLQAEASKSAGLVAGCAMWCESTGMVYMLKYIPDDLSQTRSYMAYCCMLEFPKNVQIYDFVLIC